MITPTPGGAGQTSTRLRNAFRNLVHVSAEAHFLSMELRFARLKLKWVHLIEPLRQRTICRLMPSPLTRVLWMPRIKGLLRLCLLLTVIYLLLMSAAEQSAGSLGQEWRKGLAVALLLLATLQALVARIAGPVARWIAGYVLAALAVAAGVAAWHGEGLASTVLLDVAIAAGVAAVFDAWLESRRIHKKTTEEELGRYLADRLRGPIDHRSVDTVTERSRE